MIDKKILLVLLVLALGCAWPARAKQKQAPKAPSKTPASRVGTGKQASSARPRVGPFRPVTLPRVHERTLANGLRVFVIEHHEQPVVALELMVRSGASSDPAGKAGLAQLTAALLDKGTASMKATEIAATIDGAGGSLDASAARDATRVSCVVLSNRTEVGAALMADITMRPAFAADEVERVRSQVLDGLRVAAASPGPVADSALERVVFGSDPYGSPQSGTPDTVRSISRDDLVAFHASNYRPNNAILAIVGDIAPAAAFAHAEKHFSGWEKLDRAEVSAIPATGASRRLIVLDRPGSAQTEIRLGRHLPGMSDPFFYPGLVATTVLGGTAFSSRLNSELRVKRGLTYGSSASYEPLARGGLFRIGLSTKTESTVEALDLIFAELERARTTDVSAEELEARQSFLAGTFSLRLETPGGVAEQLLRGERLGVGARYLSEHTKKIAAVTVTDVRRAFSTLGRADELVIVLAGDASKFADSLGRFGTVERIPFDEFDVMSASLRRAMVPGPVISAADARAGGEMANRTIDALGGEAFAGQKSQVARGTGTLFPAPGQSFPVRSISLWEVFPDRERTELDLGGMQIKSAFDGTSGWVDQGGGAQDRTADFTSKRLYGIRALRAFRGGGWTARPLAEVAVDGKAYQGFALVDAAGHETSFWVDPQTWLPYKLAYRAGDTEVAVVFADYREIGRVRVPFAMEQYRGGSKFIALTFSEVLVDVAVEESLFARP